MKTAARVLFPNMDGPKVAISDEDYKALLIKAFQKRNSEAPLSDCLISLHYLHLVHSGGRTLEGTQAILNQLVTEGKLECFPDPNGGTWEVRYKYVS